MGTSSDPAWTRDPVMRKAVLGAYVMANVTAMTLFPWARDEDGNMPFNSGVWVMVIEITKLLASIAMAYNEGVLSSVKFDRSSLQSAVPAVVYCLDNNMIPSIIALIDPATVGALMNLKVATSAFFLWLLLGRKFNGAHVSALFLVTCGAALTQETNQVASADYAYDPAMLTIGSAMAVFTCLMSGFAGVLSEKLLKGGAGGTNIHVANIKLYTFGVLVNGLSALTRGLYTDPNNPHHIFKGFNKWAWITALLAASTGLMTALVLKYFDVLIKSFSTTAAMILKYISSVTFFGKQISLQFSCAVAVLATGVYIYNIVARELDEARAAQRALLAGRADDEGDAENGLLLVENSKK